MFKKNSTVIPVGEAAAPKDDVAAPEAKAKTATKVKKPSPKLVPNNLTPAPVRPNSGAIPAVQDMIDETLDIEKQIKALNAAKKDIRNRAKVEFGVLAWNWTYELGMRKKDRDVRIQLEAGQVDLKQMLGYQLSLGLNEDTVPRTEEEHINPAMEDRGSINRIG